MLTRKQKQPETTGERPLKTSVRKKIADTRRLYGKDRAKIRALLDECDPNEIKSEEEVLADIKKIIWEYDGNLKHLKKEYFDEHLHSKGRNVSEFCTWDEWIRWNLVLAQASGEMANILLDKNRTRQYLRGHSIPVSMSFGEAVWKQNMPVCRLTGGEMRKLSDLLASAKDLFLKPIDSYQGKGYMKLQATDIKEGCLVDGHFIKWEELKDRFEDGPLIVEELVRGHSRLSAFHPSSLNTLRIVTMYTPGGKIEVLFSLFRMGAGSSSIDNWCSGGLCVKINSDGKLVNRGFFEDLSKGACERHPDTGISFAGFQVPFYKESVELALKAHYECPQMFSVGWDIAVTEKGPLVQEGNVHWALFQPIHGGLRPLLNCWLRPNALAVMNNQPRPWCHEGSLH